MRIVIDLQGTQTGSRFRGIGRYSLSLAQALAKHAHQHEVWLCFNAALPQEIAIQRAFDGLVAPERMLQFNIPKSVAVCRPQNLWRYHCAEVLREAFFAQLQPDIVHISSLFEDWGHDAVTSINTLFYTPTAVTVYDLIPLLNAETYLPDKRAKQWYQRKIDSLKRARLMLAISEYARYEALAHLAIEPNSITNISSAISPAFQPIQLTAETLTALKMRYGITQSYVLCNGSLEMRKNIERLMQAFAQLPEFLRTHYQLVLVGKVDAESHLQLYFLARKYGISTQFVITGYTPDEDLIALYSYCSLFVLPSLHEGFGLPALEAMACGAPTIGSNVTSIPEVIGYQDALFDPYDIAAISAKIAQVLTDNAFNQQLREHARLQAAKFSWDNSAKLALAAFEHYYQTTKQPVKTWKMQYTHQQQIYQTVIERIIQLPRDPQPTEEDLRQIAISLAYNQSVTEHLSRQTELPKAIDWRIEGPFDSSYSLALLNRETALALAALGHRVQLQSTDGPGDFAPQQAFLQTHPVLAKFYNRAQKHAMFDAQVTSRNLYPPRVSDMNCRLNLLHHYAWEESGFPAEWVNQFNTHLQGITCLSQHVAKIMRDQGVTVPLSVSGCGVDHWERIVAEDSYTINARSFRLLHVSSCFPRKGVDSLLKAYGQAFTAQEDVTLVIKTFPNPHNEIHTWLQQAKAQQPNFPDVLLIEADLTDAQLKALYQQCQVLVAPSRAEGFGLPLAEAMLSNLAVITTAWGGQLDFCNSETAWLVDYEFQRANTHFELFDSVWAEPNIADLTQTLKNVYALPVVQREERAKKGRELLLTKHTWQQVALRLVSAARHYAKRPLPLEPRIGWISTWNTRCGIATYSAHLIQAMPTPVKVLAAHSQELQQPDTDRVYRCWDVGEQDALQTLSQVIAEQQLSILVIQFNYGFFNLETFANFLNAQLDAGRIIVINLHSTVDPVHDPHKRLAIMCTALVRCQRILVHTRNDLNRLKALNLVDNVTLFPHGILDYTPPLVKPHMGFIIASYGFFLPHKGLLELIRSIALLRQQGLNVQLHLINAEYPIAVSRELIAQAQALITTLKLGQFVMLQTAYLNDTESLEALSVADLVVFPYQETGESASGAARYGLVSERPVVVTPLAIFDDIAPVVHYLPGFTPELIATGIAQLLNNKDSKMQHTAQRWREMHRYSALGLRLNNLLLALQQQALDELPN